ncbi:pyrimidine 5'-nucleotidase [Paracoccus sp. DMF-8]|uniref:pyrimidine 5'-nucleotidase n=1 Tax=Paracoccus sp. DMF-8 TaxID=3019445 RepID=UPI0023E45EEF|nr:pyrimidine 5'-nucleotidase [Paracoccus sp. DMF-8]MDF3608457.1 pyrimidine 5'-nucleotidase [Paracoccus sp. DMF-8]
MKLNHVDTWIFDLDNTLYAPEVRLFDQIERRMTQYVMRVTGAPEAEASRLRNHYWRQHGTTLAGLMAEHAVDPVPYLREVHDIDFSALTPDPDLAALISALPGRKIVHTNGDSTYARRVLEHRGLDIFEAVYGIEEVAFHPKPDARAYHAVIAAHGLAPTRAAMFEDDPRNLLVPDALGMATILVGSGLTGADPVELDQDHGAHVHHRTNDLSDFLRGLAGDSRSVTP